MTSTTIIKQSGNDSNYSGIIVSISIATFSFLAGGVSVFVLGHVTKDEDDGSIVWGYGPWRRRIIEEWTSRIGELPSRRKSHWPWETIRRRVLSFQETRNENEEEQQPPQSSSENRHPTTTDKQSSKQETKDNHQYGHGHSSHEEEESEHDDDVTNKSDLCIGSIFGLDVGGSLAKLVYFEQKPAEYSYDYPINVMSSRGRHYSVAASAKAVLLARRGRENPEKQVKVRRRRSLSLGSMGRAKDAKQKQDAASSESVASSIHSEASDHDIQQLSMLRQESLPDDLHEYSLFVNKSPPLPPRPLLSSNADTQGDGTKTGNNSMKKSKSMLDISESRDRAEALDRFYDFARRLDSYREGLKDHALSFYSRELGGEFHFIRFETRRMRNAMDLIRANNLHKNIHEMGATGGGAHKFAQLWKKSLGIEMDKQEELDSLVAGMQFVLATVVGECYTFRPPSPNKKAPCSSEQGLKKSSSQESSFSTSGSSLNSNISDRVEDESSTNTASGDEWWLSRKVQRDSVSYSSAFPYLLVSIGTGVSILRVDGPRRHTRISGSTIGGGTYWGLIRLLTDVENFEDVLGIAEKGDPSKVDMLVGDIYGDNPEALEKLGLPADIVASSFGKLVAKEDPAKDLKQEDLARALLLMVTNNIGQVAYLNAQLHKTSRIYFVGNFLRNNTISQRRLSSAISFWSKGSMEALFLEHEGYFGALGAFLLSQNITEGEEGFFQWGSEEDNEKIAKAANSKEVLSSHHHRRKTVGP